MDSKYTAELAKLRKAGVEAAEVMQAAQRELERSEPYKKAAEAKNLFNEISNQAEIAAENLRNHAIQNFKDTGEKDFPGGKIIIRKLRQYDDEAAIAWAVSKQLTSVLRLDKRKFTKIADVEVPDFYTTVEEPATRIDSHLDDFLEE